jgi:hypothetical protein
MSFYEAKTSIDTPGGRIIKFDGEILGKIERAKRRSGGEVTAR